MTDTLTATPAPADSGDPTPAAKPSKRLSVPQDPRAPYRAGSWTVIVLVLVALHLVAFSATDFKPEKLVTGAQGMMNFLGEAIPPDLSADVLQKGIEGALVTLWIGLLGTTISVPLALLLAVFGARTTTPISWRRPTACRARCASRPSIR